MPIEVPMGVRRELLKWQYSGYPEYHRSKVNLLVHIVAVPSFTLGTLWTTVALVQFDPYDAVGGALTVVLSFALQAFGHGREPTPSIPFDGPDDAISRILAEQFVTFPRFVASGGWFRALRAGG